MLYSCSSTSVHGLLRVILSLIASFPLSFRVRAACHRQANERKGRALHRSKTFTSLGTIPDKHQNTSCSVIWYCPCLQVAIKFWPRDPDCVTVDVQRELHNHSRFRHPNIIQFREVFLTPTHLGLAMEFATAGDLFKRVKTCKGLPVCMQLSATLPGKMMNIPVPVVLKCC